LGDLPHFWQNYTKLVEHYRSDNHFFQI